LVLRRILILFSALAASALLQADDLVWVGKLQIRLIEGGFARSPVTGRYYPNARLIFRNAGPKPIQETISVELSDGPGAPKLVKWKTLLRLKPGKSLEARYGRQSLAKWASPSAATGLGLRVRAKAGLSDWMPIPPQEFEPQAFPAQDQSGKAEGE
jgi:hypothetical protein